MNEYIALSVGLGATRATALSALPDAPVVTDDADGRSARGWTAARLRSLAGTTDRLANRVDPACRPATA